MTAAKTKQDAASLRFSLPVEWHLWDNFIEVLKTRNYMLLLAYFNSTVITVVSVMLLVLFGAMVGYVLQRRPSRWNTLIYGCVLAGLMIPPAWPFQVDIRHDPDPSRLWPRIYRPALQKLYCDDSARSR
jgi:raffinose/stachyose/melibiose transport system permease protein